MNQVNLQNHSQTLMTSKMQEDFRKDNKIEIECTYCHCKFTLTINRANNNKKYYFCNMECNKKYMIEKKTRTCSICQTKYFYGGDAYNPMSNTIRPIDGNWFCSKKCKKVYLNKLPIHNYNCSFCNAPLLKYPSRLKNTMYNRLFCSHSCRAKYTQKFLMPTVTVSKFEKMVQEFLISRYKEIPFVFNDRQICNGLELDIYIPSLKLAIEVNGRHHYLPIKGGSSLERRMKYLEGVKNRDKRKQTICENSGIKLLIVDTSDMYTINETTAEPYYHTISQFIDSNIPIISEVSKL